ncbi:hypothetical protein BDV26DRAFT_272846 [Aspergillus bertholletiae]|uniref:Uncharacterized protein n=1 Tax=Aspergillus bertholletiae TaxID=1226010 RepID=A0A5N7AUV3_9EURO|nr:hypothetical protein BDV26DRAFT_272846 [Aspergillus bertholletiae]
MRAVTRYLWFAGILAQEKRTGGNAITRTEQLFLILPACYSPGWCALFYKILVLRLAHRLPSGSPGQKWRWLEAQ